jgi:glycosyltransferase involved in cell wall biosynthesis/GT2 family glycosyltransferase
MAQRICIVTCDLVGPVRNGGIGTALTAFAELMVEAGNDVTILYPSNHTETEPVEYWIDVYAEKKILLESLFAPESGKYLSYLVYQWLKAQEPFDVIHYHDWLGIGFWTATAKRQGLAFQQTTLVCQVHGQTIWHLEHSGEFVSDVQQIETDYMERRGVELANLVFSPSQYMIEWMRSRDWQVPARTFVRPNLLPRRFSQLRSRTARTGERAKITEIVFFGRLETRKGLQLFCEAIDPIARTRDYPLSITFLGKVGQVSGGNATQYITRAAADWAVPHQIISDYDVYTANEYLAEGSRLAVIASSIENSPYTVLECLALDIPFVAADVGGIGELIAAEDRADTLFKRDKKLLNQLLRRVLDRGAVVARPAAEIEENREVWKRWHAGLAAPQLPRPAITASSPLVSVCISTYDRPELCSVALNSLERQTYSKVEVVLVDDASPSRAAREFIADLAPAFARRGWRVIRNDVELWTGASRNVAVANSTGEFVLLMDDDNVARPHEVETLVSAAAATGADILTCQQQPFAGMELPPPFEAELPIGFMPIGPNLSQALYDNCLGDLNMMVRRHCWDEIGGFTDERCGCEDYEFLARAVLAGYHLECLPEILFYYRVSAMALAKRYDHIALYKSFMRALRPFTSAVPKELQLGVMLANSSRRHAEKLAGNGYWGT